MFPSVLYCIVVAGQVSPDTEIPSKLEERTQYFIAAGDSLFDQELYREAVGSYLMAAKEATPDAWPEVYFALQVKLARSLSRVPRYEEAILHLENAEASPLFAQNKKIQAEVYSIFGAVFVALGGYSKASKYHFKALEIRRKASDAAGEADSRYEIGVLYAMQQEYNKARSQLLEAQGICEADPSIDPFIRFKVLTALGDVFAKLNDGEESLRYNKRALTLAEKEGKDRNRAYALLNIGQNHIRQENYSTAGSYLKQSLELSKAIGIPRVEILSHQRLAELHLKQNHPKAAISALYEAYFLCKNTGAKGQLVEVLLLLADAFEAIENYGAANTYLREYTALKDTLLNEATLKETEMQNTLYELEKKEESLRSLKDSLEAQKEADKRVRSGFIVASVTLLALVAVLLWFSISQRRTNQMLKQLNQRIEVQNRKLESYNEELRQYASVASHDLKEPLRSIGSFVSIIKLRYTDQLDEQAKEYMNYVTTGVSRLQHLLNDLLAYTSIERERTDFEQVETGEVVNSVISGLQQTIAESSAQIIVDYSSMPTVFGNRSRLAQVFQNLIGNAVKFRGEVPPLIEVGCLRRTSKPEYLFFVKDNGIGIPEDFREKMFEMFTRRHYNHVYEGSGIGLATCRKIVENHGGRIWAESEKGMGSAIFFALPVDEPAHADGELPALSHETSVQPRSGGSLPQ